MHGKEMPILYKEHISLSLWFTSPPCLLENRPGHANCTRYYPLTITMAIKGFVEVRLRGWALFPKSMPYAPL